MDAVEFLKEKERMHRTFNMRCKGCEIANRMEGNELCDEFVKRCPEEAVAIVEKWSKEHPPKTRQSEFLKMFPMAKVDADCVVAICPNETCIRFKCCLKWGESTEQKCRECRKKFWLEEIE